MRIALVTGASSGLGREFVRQLDRERRLEVDELWVIARREERLEELKSCCAHRVRPLPMDLTRRESIQELKTLLEREKPDIAVLVCAAGLGRIGRTWEISDRDNDAMIDLNCRAAVDVTSICLPYLRRGSRVLELCSTAGFQPMPELNVYAATKAFLLSYTKTLHYELRGRGIRVTAVCPYWVKDTEFIPKAKEHEPGGFRHFPLASRAENVVRRALWDSKWNLWVSTPGSVCAVHRLTAKFIPHVVMVPLMDLVRRL